MLKSALIFAVALGSLAVRASEVKELSPVEEAVAIYNSIETRDQLIFVMQMEASDSDVAYLDLVRSKIQDPKLPKVRVEGRSIYIKGLEKPILVEDLKTGLFSYNGSRFTFDLKQDFRTNMQRMEQVIHPERSAWLNFILPQAYADFDFVSMLLGGAVVGAVGVGYMATDPTTKMMGYGVAAAGGVAALIKWNNERKEKAERRRRWREKLRAGYYGPYPPPYGEYYRPMPTNYFSSRSTYTSPAIINPNTPTYFPSSATH